MTTPSDKNEVIEESITSIFGVYRRASIESDICAICCEAITEFRDDTSRKEYTISGMCQKCQDSVFGVD